MSEMGQTGSISLRTMRARKRELEQLGAGGDLELLRVVADRRQRQEEGNPANSLTAEQIATIEGLTGIKAEYELPAGSNLGSADRGDATARATGHCVPAPGP